VVGEKTIEEMFGDGGLFKLHEVVQMNRNGYWGRCYSQEHARTMRHGGSGVVALNWQQYTPLLYEDGLRISGMRPFQAPSKYCTFMVTEEYVLLTTAPLHTV
jgi:hypothetical protein